MESIVGHHLYASDGHVGEITDVVGVQGTDLSPSWYTVKTGWFGQRLVPAELVEGQDDRFVTRCDVAAIKGAPKVPVHFEPSGDDLDALLHHYGIARASA